MKDHSNCAFLWFFEKKIFEGKIIRLVFFFFRFCSFSRDACSEKRGMINNFAELLQLLFILNAIFILYKMNEILFSQLRNTIFVEKYPILSLDIVLVVIVTHLASKIM